MKMEQIHILSFPYVVCALPLHCISLLCLSTQMSDGKWRRIYVLKAENIQRGSYFVGEGKNPVMLHIWF